MRIAFLMYDNFTALDLVGPYEFLSRLPGAQTERVALKPGPIVTCSGLKIVADRPLSEVPAVDILVVPGSGKASSLSHSPETLEWIRQIHEKTTWTTSVCTGSLVLGAAGILKGLKATSHWAALDQLDQWGAIPVQKRVVEDGKVMTAAGVSAGIDMALTLAAKVAGEGVAKTLQLGLEYDPAPPFDVGSPQKAPPAIVEALRNRIKARFEGD